MDVADDACFIYQEGNSSCGVKLLYGTAFIGNKREIQAVLLAEFLLCRQAVGADTQDLGVELFKSMEIFLKSLHFASSDRGEIGQVEG